RCENQPNTPNVYSLIYWWTIFTVVPNADHFRGKPTKSASVASGKARIASLSKEVKVRYFGLKRFISDDKHVSRLQIAMDEACLVQLIDAIDEILCKGKKLPVGHHPVLVRGNISCKVGILSVCSFLVDLDLFALLCYSGCAGKIVGEVIVF